MVDEAHRAGLKLAAHCWTYPGAHNAARQLGVDRERGAIKPGFAADIIAMPENPLEHIQAVRKVSFVMKDGSVFKGQ